MKQLADILALKGSADIAAIANKLYHSLGIINVSTGAYVRFDFQAKTVTFPNPSFIRWGNDTYTINGGVLNLADGTTNRGYIFFDTSTESIEVSNNNDLSDLPYTAIPIAVYSITFKTVVILCERYTIDGSLPIILSTDMIDTKANALDTFANNFILDETPFDLTFAFITDTHGVNGDCPNRQSEDYLHMREVAYLSKILKLDCAIHGGDVSYDYCNKTSFISNMLQCLREFRKTECPVLLTQGNHDTGDWYAWQTEAPDPEDVITPIAWSKMMAYENNCVFGDSSKSYYYKDFESAKVRIIVLNHADAYIVDEVSGKLKYNRSESTGFQSRVHGWRQDQIDWFSDVALDFTGKDGWGVIVVSHQGIIPALEGQIHPYNQELVYGILKARKGKTTFSDTTSTTDFAASVSVDYSEANDVDVICTICGHIHADNLVVDDSINHISVTSSRDFDTGDTLNSAWDVFGIDTTNKAVKIKRFGNRGENRSFSY